MALLNGQVLCDEVAWRIQNRIAANSTGAGSIINFANDCLGLISSAASWMWDEIAVQPPVTVGTGMLVTPITGMDVGKKISVFDPVNLQPIVRVAQDDYQSSAQGYTGVVATSYNTFRLTVDPSTFVGTLQLYPPIAGNVLIYYHQTPPVLVYGSSPTVRWGVQEMDDLLKDWTEAKVKQKLGMAGWDTLWADCIGRVGELRKMYSTERENTGPDDEAKSLVADKNSVGRD